MGAEHSIRVPAEGPKNARIVVLGESPGRQELRAGRPFVGESGQIQDSLLNAVGLDRRDVYFTNVVKTLPTDPKEEFFFSRGAPTPQYMDGILEAVAEIRSIRPNVVVPVGNYALWALTQHMNITNRRGSILESTVLPGQKVIPTIHPAFFIHSRQWHQFILCEWDWARIAEEALTPEINLPVAKFWTSPSTLDIELAIERYTDPSVQLLAVDSEWYSPDSLAYIGFADSNEEAFVIPATSMQAYRAYKAILGSDVPKLIQNAAFDAVAFARIGITVRNIKHDALLGFAACWGDLRRNRLSMQCSVLTRWPFYKDDVEFVGKDDEKGQEYCGMDCVVTHESMTQMLNNEMQWNVSGGARGYELSMLNMDIFIEASKKGVRCDLDKLRALKKMYTDRANETEQHVSTIAGYTLNCRSWQQVQKFVYNDLGMGDRYTSRSTEQEVLMDIAAAETEPQLKAILTAVIRVRQDRNIVSRYINEDIVDRDGRLRTNWNLAGTRNGRYSTSDPWWNGWAMQTVPLDAREVAVADPGCVFIGWDLAQAEGRIVAVLTHDYDLLDAMEQGIDIHIKLAEDMGIFGKTYDQIKADCQRTGKDKNPPRVLCKVSRHAMNYYLTWSGLKLRINKDYLDTGVGVNAALAKLVHNRYMELHSGLEGWWEEVFQSVKRHSYLVNDFGRRRNFLGKLEKHDHLHRDAIAFQPQSDIADLTTISINEADRELKKLDPASQCMAHMHDGGFFQIKDECKEEGLEVLRRCMTKELTIGRDTLTVPVEVKSGYNWKEMQ